MTDRCRGVPLMSETSLLPTVREDPGTFQCRAK